MKTQIQLLIIDPQNDFCDVPDTHLPHDARLGATVRPALPVAGAHADMQRVASLVHAGGTGLADITVTLDSHHRLDIAHPTFWQRGSGHGAGCRWRPSPRSPRHRCAAVNLRRATAPPCPARWPTSMSWRPAAATH